MSEVVAGRSTQVRAMPVRSAPAGAAIAPNATMAGRVDLTASVARFVVRPDEGVPTFMPGQYFALGLPVDGRLLQRPYSTASPAGVATDLEFLVRLVPDGALTPRLWELEVGDRLRIGRPKGLFTLRPDDDRTHLLLSTGTGLAPFLAMAAALRARARPPRTVVIHGVADARELAFRDTLEAWQNDGSGHLRYFPAISRPDRPANGGWLGATGRIDTVLERLSDGMRLDPTGTIAYLCGNPAMIEAVKRVLAGRGFPADAMVSEHYWTPATGSAASTSTAA